MNINTVKLRPLEVVGTIFISPKSLQNPEKTLYASFYDGFYRQNTVRELILQLLSDQGGFEMVTHLGNNEG